MSVQQTLFRFSSSGSCSGESSSACGDTSVAEGGEKNQEEFEEDFDELLTDEETVEDCSSDCCKLSRDKPNQPTSSKVLAATKRVQGKGKSRQARFVQATWFSRYPWLSLCESRQKLFCFYCVTASNRKLMTFSTKADRAFSHSGFDNWKKASERFAKHESSQAHYMKVSSEVNVSYMLDSAHKQLQKTRHRMLLKQLSSLKYLLRQGLAIRGHTEVESNLIQLMKLRADDDGDLNMWLSDGNYLSPVIVKTDKAHGRYSTSKSPG